MSGADGTTLCPLRSKKDSQRRLISAVSMSLSSLVEVS
jgi:hypothetical protein